MVERFLSGISDAMWRQIQPFTILRALWWSSGWTLRLLFSLAKNLTYYAVSSAVGMVGAPFSLQLSLGSCPRLHAPHDVRWFPCTEGSHKHIEDSVWFRIRSNPKSELGIHYKKSVQCIRNCVSDIYSRNTILRCLLSTETIDVLLAREKKPDGSFEFGHCLPMHVLMYWLQQCMLRFDENNIPGNEQCWLVPFTRVVVECIAEEFAYLFWGGEDGAVDWLSAHAEQQYEIQFPDRIEFDADDWELFTVRYFFPAIGLCLRGNYCYIPSP
jgi:hypothetical protein